MKGLYVEAEWAPREEFSLSKRELENQALIRGYTGWKKLKYTLRDDLPTPEYNEDQILIKVKSCGICGSDISLFHSDMDGYTDYASQCSFPVIIGHEFSGEVAAVGKNVQNFQVGDFVTAEDNHWCGQCIPCRHGDVNQCENLKSMGFDRGHNGAMAEYLAVDAKYCWSLNLLKNTYKDADIFDMGALVEPLACAYEAIVNVSKGFYPGDNVVILGAGGIGLACLQLLKTIGAAKIIVFEPLPFRRELALKMGADVVLDPFDNGYLDHDILWEITNGQGVGLAIEASHNPSRNFALADNALRFGGEFLCVGMSPQYPRMDYQGMVRRNLTYSGAFGHAGHSNFYQIINLLNAGRIDILPCITDRYPLDNALDALKAASSGSVGKVIVNP